MKISMCTVCKDRQYHVAETLIKNMEDNKEVPGLEFILLDYNSGDGLEDWAKSHLAGYIDSGLLTYYKTREPAFFSQSHSRNMIFRLAKGDIICNIDADNFTGPGFAAFIERAFAHQGSIFVCPGGQYDNLSHPDLSGRICMRRRDFLHLEGYDESMDCYGFEDVDLINRMERYGVKKRLLSITHDQPFIPHDTASRISSSHSYQNIESLLVQYITPSVSRLLFLFKDRSYATNLLINPGSLHSADIESAFQSDKAGKSLTLAEARWQKGSFVQAEGAIELIRFDQYPSARLSPESEGVYMLTAGPDRLAFYRIASEATVNSTIFFYYYLLPNKMKMEWNNANMILQVNNGRFGNGTVYRNFDYDHPIVL